MTQTLISAHSVQPQPWRNGCGQTRELLVWPEHRVETLGRQLRQAWQLRISVADITEDGPFSAFEGVSRWFTVVTGAGVKLQFADGPVTLRAGDAPLAFDGAAAPGCTLLGGATLDLNLMVRHGQGTLKMIADNASAVATSVQFGLFSRVAGKLTDACSQCIRVPAMSLFWNDQVIPASHWQFEPDVVTHDPVGWWMGFTPAGATA